MEWCNDVFDILNEDDEDLESIMEEYNQDFDFDYLNTTIDEEEMSIEEEGDEENNIIKNEQKHETIGEEFLPQNLSQLSTQAEKNNRKEQEDYVNSNNTRSTSEVVSKKIRTWYDYENEPGHPIHDYCQTLNNIFDKIIIDHVKENITHMSIEDVRQLAILKHKIVMTELNIKLWTLYLKSGTGQWETLESVNTNVDQRVWPMAIRKMFASPSTTIDTNQNNDQQKLYETIVSQHLEQLNQQIEIYLMEYHDKKSSFIGLTDCMEKDIETFVQQHSLVPFKLKLNYKMTILEYDYNDELLEREYLRQNPTDYQKNVAQHLYDIAYTYVQAKCELIELKQRILCNKPPEFIYTKALSMISTSMLYSTTDASVCQRHIDQEEKILQETITDMMTESITEAEKKILRCRQLLNEDIHRVSINDKDMNERFSEELVDLIERRVKIINQKSDYMSNFKINYCLRNHFDDLQDTLTIPNIRFSPTIIMGTVLHLLTEEQLKLLNRGPTYVPPCQMYVSSSCLSINEIIQKQYKSLQYDLNIVYDKLNVNLTQRMLISKKIKEKLTNVFSISLPNSLRERALYEKQLVQSIREHFKVNDLILRRTADQQNVFYLGNRNEFDEKTNDYMKTTDAFQLCESVDEQNLQTMHNYLANKIKSLNEDFQVIFSHNDYKDIRDKLYISLDNVKLPYLYFLPDISQNKGLRVQPVVVAQHSITAELAHFLDQLLRPIVQRQLESTTFVNGADFIQKLNDYIEKSEHRLHSTTKFATIKITNYYDMIDHDAMLIALRDFFRYTVVVPAIGNISIGKIYRLIALFLRNNQFYYDHKIYCFAKGSPMSFPLTETLCNIYILQWQNLLFRQSSLENEFYGRCKNQLLFTWNDTHEKCLNMIKMMSRETFDLCVDIETSSCARFLNVYIENQSGVLYSRVSHDQTRQQYSVPYVVGNSKVAHSHWLRSALIRAVRYCTSVYDFNHERIYLEVTCLANGYPLEFIEKRIDRFFKQFDAVSLRSVLDQDVYKKLRQRSFNFISEQRQVLKTNQELAKKKQRFRLSYLYEFGSKHKFNKELQGILSQYLNPKDQYSNHKKIKFILTTKSQHSLNALLSEQKPTHDLLNKNTTMF
ncbi:unnamed protein product [Rotaria sp. Silwood2]|nr:unnamed protein product [Rotaria sp. Silwood2]CAF4242349.1 unnamed protein product [Rotaria sp. Silwood2]